MKTYTVNVTAVYIGTIEVSAENEQQAKETANEEIKLGKQHPELQFSHYVE